MFLYSQEREQIPGAIVVAAAAGLIFFLNVVYGILLLVLIGLMFLLFITILNAFSGNPGGKLISAFDIDGNYLGEFFKHD